MAEAKKKAAEKAEEKTVKKPAKKTEEKAEKKTAKKAAEKSEEKPAKKNAAKKEAEFFEYKGKPLVRSGKTLYYGDINDPYVVCLMVKSEKEIDGEMIADDVQVQLLATDETLSPKDRVIKKSEKKGLWVALDLGVAWLERQLKKG